MQQQHVLKQLTSQRPLSASACAAVANLIQVTSAAISANESQAGSSMLMDESEQTLENVGELESGTDGGFIKEENGVSHANDGSQSSQYGQDGTSFDNPSPDTFKVEPQIDDVNLSDNMISNGTDQSQQSSLPVDLSTSDQCQETVDTFMKLVGGGDDNVFDNNTVTVMQQPLGQQQSVSGSQIGSPNVATSAADFFNGFEMMQPAEHKLFPQTSSVIGPKRRGRPPGSGWKMQQRELMGATLATDTDCSLPTMVPTTMSSQTVNNSHMRPQQTPTGIPGLPYGSGIRKLHSQGTFPRPRGRPRGSVNRLSTAREYLEFSRAYYQFKQQMKFGRFRGGYKSVVSSVNSHQPSGSIATTSSASTSAQPGIQFHSDPLTSQTSTDNPGTQLVGGAADVPGSGHPGGLLGPSGHAGTAAIMTSESSEDILMSEGNSPTMSTFHTPNCVSLDVGGHLHYTSVSTLSKFPTSNLYKLTLGSEEGKCDVVNGDRLRQCSFIDRDPTVFEYILNYIRSDNLCLPSDFNKFDLLQIEASFYDIPGLDTEVERQRSKSTKYSKAKTEPTESHYLLLEFYRISKKIEISGERKAVDLIFNPQTDVFVDPSCQYYQSFPLSDSVKNLAVPQAVDRILSYGTYKLFKVSTITLENEPITSYHFVIQ
ncbi:uncharacterized protein LOC142341449 isoform X2 [Convolutriloba macropyga]|uniref:uncharacterized protein LOC142341449 isoform X2 n=1 Tax=Convolutriloba macropyga TaxID=536237 RepID=UPI003F51C181